MFEYYKWHEKLPDESLEVYEPNLNLFFQIMYERQMIWKRRFLEGKERPWTDNAILSKYKFTNVYRELDRSSQWQIKHILLDSDLSLTNLIWKLMVYRFFNNPETFTNDLWRNGIPDYKEYNEDEFADFIQSLRDKGLNPYTNAYLINSMATPGKPRDYCYTRLVIPSLHKAIPRYTDREFMKFDQNDFTNVGPGASVGIRLIFPNLKGKEQKQGIYRLRDMAEKYLSNIGKEKDESFPYLHFDKAGGWYYVDSNCNITLHQIEMWLCEFQKYWKMTIGEGKQRSEFIPKTKTIK